MKMVYIIIIIILFSGCYSKNAYQNEYYEKEYKYYYKSNNKLITGKILKYHPNGVLHYEVNLKKGIKYGKEAYYFTTGNILFLKEYKKGIENGQYLEADIITQKILEKGMYKNGRKDGQWEIFYRNGKIKERGTYKNNKKIGEWIYYNIDGSIEKTILE